MTIAEVKTIYESNRIDIPSTLRKIAEQIESGHFANVVSVTLVAEGDVIDVCYLGKGDSDRANMMLSLAQRKLQRMMENQYAAN